VSLSVLYHFSEDAHIARFVPHVPRTNPSHAAAVWAIDAEHAPLYWFPRACPRIAIWPRNPRERTEFEARFVTSASRLHAIESAWLDSMRTVQIYRYEFDASGFTPWADANGQWISHSEVAPLSVTPMRDLLDVHVQAAIELRIVPSLWPLHDIALGDEFDFSMVRMHNALPRIAP
jgi:hypothetical protein